MSTKVNEPLISVIMSVYNSEEYLKEAIESILNQTYKNFEFIIINDGSTDRSLEIIKNFMQIDNRIVLIDQENKGLANSLNIGIRLAKGNYIARMDADDISEQKRFAMQISYMQEHNIELCGGYIQVFDNTSYSYINKYPLSDSDIKFQLMFQTAFAHPSIMAKKSIFENILYYNLNVSQDYDLWTRLAMNNVVMGTIPEIILKYREHNSQASNLKKTLQRKIALEISERYTEFYTNNANFFINNIQDNVGHKQMYTLLKNIVKIGKGHNISNYVIIDNSRNILKKARPAYPTLYIPYLIATINIQKSIQEDLLILIQMLFRVNRQSTVFKLIKTVLR